MITPETIIGMAEALHRRDEKRPNFEVMSDLLSVPVTEAEAVLLHGLSVAGELTEEDSGDTTRLVVNALMVGITLGVAAEACQKGGVRA